MKKRWISPIFAILILVALFYLLDNIGIDKIINLMGQADPLFLFLAFVSCFLVYFIWNFIWVICLREIGNKLSILSTLPIYFSGIFFNTITPGAKVGGEPMKVYYLSKIHNGGKTNYLAGTFIQKVFDYTAHLIFIIFSLISIVFLFSFSEIKDLLYITVLALIFIFFIVFIIFINRRKSEKIIGKFSFLYSFFNNRFEDKESFSNFLIEKYRHFTSYCSTIVSNKKLSVALLFVAVIDKFFYYLTFYLVFIALGIDFAFIYIIITATFMLFFAEIVPIPGGVGFTESGLILLYSLFGLPAVEAGAVTIIVRGIEYFYSLVVGSLVYLILKFRYNND